MSSARRKRRKKVFSTARSRKALPTFTHRDIEEFLERVVRVNRTRIASERYPEIDIKALTRQDSRPHQVFRHDINSWIKTMERQAPRLDVWFRSIPCGHYNPLVKLSVQGDCEFDILYVVRSKRQRVIYEDREDEDYLLEQVRDRCTPANRVDFDANLTYVLTRQQPLWFYYMDACLDVLVERNATVEKLFHLEPLCDISDMTLDIEATLVDATNAKTGKYSIRQHHGPSSWFSVHLQANPATLL